MSRRGTFDGKRQKDALRALLIRTPDGLMTRGGKSLTDLAQEVGLSYGQLWRYVDGVLPLRSDQFATFADAFETSEAALLRACFRSVTKDETGLLHDLLVAANVDEDRIRDALAEVAGRGLSPAILEHIAAVVIDAAQQPDVQRRRSAD